MSKPILALVLSILANHLPNGQQGTGGNKGQIETLANGRREEGGSCWEGGVGGRWGKEVWEGGVGRVGGVGGRGGSEV